MSETTRTNYLDSMPAFNPMAALGELKWFQFAGRWSIDYVLQQAEKVFVRGERILMNPKSSPKAAKIAVADMWAYLHELRYRRYVGLEEYGDRYNRLIRESPLCETPQ